MGAILPIKVLVWGGIFSSLFVAVDKKVLAHLLDSGYGVRRALMCEISWVTVIEENFVTQEILRSKKNTA